jgi:hypothetical protein
MKRSYLVTIDYDPHYQKKYPKPLTYKATMTEGSPKVAIGRALMKFKKEDGKGLRLKRWVITVEDLGPLTGGYEDDYEQAHNDLKD